MRIGGIDAVPSEDYKPLDFADIRRQRLSFDEAIVIRAGDIKEIIHRLNTVLREELRRIAVHKERIRQSKYFLYDYSVPTLTAMIEKSSIIIVNSDNGNHL